MKTIFKIFVLIILFSLLSITCVNAANIMMNLDSNPLINNQTNEDVDVNDIIDSNSVNATAEDEAVNNIINNEINSVVNNSENSTPQTITTKTVSNDDEFLTIENILSIIIIVIGVLLIFLSVAILIRCK